VDPAPCAPHRPLRLEPIRSEACRGPVAPISGSRSPRGTACWRSRWAREAGQDLPTLAADGVHKWMPTIGCAAPWLAAVGCRGLTLRPRQARDRVGPPPHVLGHGYATEIGRAGLAFAFDELAADEVVSYPRARNAGRVR